ncbi:lipoprotein-releasing system ATP-binding protein LolD [candidate division BRC1 bacterium HGW-BRC1-1]|jgi:lipoprotein-releasing system ATP-binding protein|nr:MAG: lipoprotein-releasing system ATP-binding protein LolD [candidate division BRC1 bacterium HGW-BRC1-1]
MSDDRRVILEARNIEKDYHDGTRVLKVLRGTSLQVRAGEIVSIVGASGSGKSTLLHLLGALDRPTSGQVLLNGQDFSSLPADQLADMRNRGVGFIFQFHHLLAEFTALENVIVPGLIQGLPVEGVRAAAKERLESLGLGERLTHRPSKLSGGEQQRVSLARAMVGNPDVILADEPTGNLDAESAQVVMDLLWKNVRDNDKALVIVTHEPDIAAQADRRMRLRDGVLVEE